VHNRISTSATSSSKTTDYYKQPSKQCTVV